MGHKNIQLTGIFIILFVLSTYLASATPGRWETMLSGDNWKLWLDKNAQWINDDIYLPPVKLATVPVNPPTCGWDNLGSTSDKKVTVPGTVEEYCWGANGNPIGIAGDFRGVSWWTTSFKLDKTLKGKKIFINFESVNLRAEVFINRKLVGYDVVGNTPFDVDVTGAVQFDGENILAVRVTDPVGNFDWNDNELYRWGKNMVPGVHGFGGITGLVTLRAVDTVYIDDIYVQNKPNPTEAEIFVTLANTSGAPKNGKLSLIIHEWKNPAAILYKKDITNSVPAEGNIRSFAVKMPKAKLWNIKDPHLYVASLTFKSSDGNIIDTSEKRFGFRYFTTGEKDGDKRFYLNGKRVFIFAAMTRGCWAVTGMFPTPEMAKRDVEMTLQLGFNMMLFHRAIGQHHITELCDEVGLLTYEEPGGYRCLPKPDSMHETWRREKLRRMIIRDRSYASMIIYNLKNEAMEDPSDDDIQNMRMVHKLDPSRILTYNSDRNRKVSAITRLDSDPIKLHMLPFDDKLYYTGWWDQHHWNPIAGYVDDYYSNPELYLRYNIEDGKPGNTIQKNEIIFWGEEGSFGSQLRLEKIKEYLDKNGSNGWREGEHLDWYKNYSRFLDESGFRAAFPTVDALTLALGKNMHYFHGRILENVRLSNIADCYNLNGWASEATHTDIVDAYRNPTGDPTILPYYAQPLYIAVKLRTKVLPLGGKSIADFYIINEKDVKGAHTLEVELVDPSGKAVYSNSYPVTIIGGEEFGQFLAGDVELPPVQITGYYRLNARLTGKSGVVTTGFDDIFVADYSTGPGIKGRGAVIDTTGVITSFLKDTRGVSTEPYDSRKNEYDFIIIGPHNPHIISGIYEDIMEKVSNGATLLILDNIDLWAKGMDNSYSFQSIQYWGNMHWGNRGRLFVGKSPYLDGLPAVQCMGWEYQDFYRGDVWGLHMGLLGTETIVGLAAEHRKEILNALVRVPFGDGQIFLTTLNFQDELASKKPQSAVGKKLFLNLLEVNQKK
ncbi:MAG: sugar-binding domain-containing protein [Candidatus Latescibacterota bacterium]